MKQPNGYPAATGVVVLILLCRITSCADPPPEIQSKVTMCFYCNESTANFTWTYRIQSVYFIQWKFNDIFMTNYTQRRGDLTQDSLSINQKYRGRFNLLHPGDVGFSLTNVTRADLGTYRCIITLDSGTGITLQGVLEETRIDRQGKVKACRDGGAVFKRTPTWGKPFQSIHCWFNNTTIASTPNNGFSKGSLRITAEYEARVHLLMAGDVGFQLDKVSAADTGTYTCGITFPSGLFNITWDLEVIELQKSNLDIVRTQGMLSCGEEQKSDFIWVFLNDSGVYHVTGAGHVLNLSSVPETGSVSCVRQSDCTELSIYNFTIGESAANNVPEEGGSQISPAAYVVPIVIIIVIGIIVLMVLYKRRVRGQVPRDAVPDEGEDKML